MWVSLVQAVEVLRARTKVYEEAILPPDCNTETLPKSSLHCRLTLTSPISFHIAWFRFPGEHSHHDSDTQVCGGYKLDGADKHAEVKMCNCVITDLPDTEEMCKGGEMDGKNECAEWLLNQFAVCNKYVDGAEWMCKVWKRPGLHLACR